MDGETRQSALPGPIVVGGVGGSGTRVVAEILQSVGVYLGADLNPYLDNLWFTLLFKRPDWFFRHSGAQREREVALALRIFERAMTRGLSEDANSDEAAFVRQAAEELRAYPREMGADRSQVASILKSRAPSADDFAAWGWKEPNSHVFLDHLAAHFAEVKYVHVVRHGLDMAFSANRQQLVNWGALFGVACPDAPDEQPPAALRYWVCANRNAVERGRRLLGPRFTVLLFDELCRNPVTEISTLLEFLGRRADAATVGDLAGLVKPPRSTGRYRRHDLSVFDRADIEAVREFGFGVQR